MITSNTKKIIRNVDKFVDVQSKNVTEALEEVGLRGVARLKSNAPVDSGRLRNSMSYTIDGKVEKYEGNRKDALRKIRDKKTVMLGTNVEYARKVEYLSTNESKGFMLRSFLELKPIADKIFETVLGKDIK